MQRRFYTARKGIQFTSPGSYGHIIAIPILIMLTLAMNMASVFAQSSNWSTFMGSNARTDYNGSESVINRKTAPNLKLLWSVKAGGSVSSQVVEANGLIYWGSGNGLEHATNPSTGSDTWATNLGQTSGKCVQNQGVTSSSTVANVNVNGQMTPVVFVGGGNVQLY
ncbi:MAG TPA: hypothetical protein VKU38_17305, partial [Ktedonobacteraceae bacterium]|nr:hypothetical protein [Ktedonobacteraceae bacterium]